MNRRAPDRDEDSDRITGVRTGDRWASVRSDERGRELRMGERRAAVRADESGTELRIEDRWAAVRRDEPRSRRESHRDSDRWDGDRRDGAAHVLGWTISGRRIEIERDQRSKIARSEHDAGTCPAHRAEHDRHRHH